MMMRALVPFTLSLSLVACSSGPSTPEARRGAVLIRDRGCGTCHTIPGIQNATATVGPSLEHIAVRTYLHGQELNTPATMAAWVQHPQLHEPRTAMPELHLSDTEARDITAYLYTLR